MRFVFLLLAALFVSTAAPAAAGYSAAIEDFPLMPGMTENAQDIVIFDKPAGRIVETALRRAPANALAYYRDALPALGWQPQGKDSYVRDGEEMTLTLSGGTLHVQISPQ